MSGISRPGFTLLQVLIAMAIIGLMAIVVVPNLAPRRPGLERKVFIAKLNSLTQLGWQNALLTNALHKVIFDFKQKRVYLEQATGKKDRKGDLQFEPVKRTYLQTSLAWPDNLQIKNFFIAGFDEMKRFAGRGTEQVWFFIVPDGLTQEVTINLVDLNDQVAGRPQKIGLVLNPFNARFTVYDTFKK